MTAQRAHPLPNQMQRVHATVLLPPFHRYGQHGTGLGRLKHPRSTRSGMLAPGNGRCCRSWQGCDLGREGFAANNEKATNSEGRESVINRASLLMAAATHPRRAKTVELGQGQLVSVRPCVGSKHCSCIGTRDRKSMPTESATKHAHTHTHARTHTHTHSHAHAHAYTGCA